MDATERDALLRAVRDLVSDFPERFSLPYVTELFWCRLPA